MPPSWMLVNISWQKRLSSKGSRREYGRRSKAAALPLLPEFHPCQGNGSCAVIVATGRRDGEREDVARKREENRRRSEGRSGEERKKMWKEATTVSGRAREKGERERERKEGRKKK